MFSCVPDLLKFVHMVMNDGIAAGANGNEIRVAPAGILKMVCENAFDSSVGACTALGWELAQSKFMGSRVSPHAFGKTGFTGASIVADPVAGAAVVLLSDFTYPHREASADRIHAFRASLADAFFGAV